MGHKLDIPVMTGLYYVCPKNFDLMYAVCLVISL